MKSKAKIALLAASRPRPRHRQHGGAGAAGQGAVLPGAVYRTGAYAPNGMPFANGYVDYLKLVNARDGGINGVKITYEECETGYATDKGVECYERLKGKGPTGATVFQPLSTGITFALTDKVVQRPDPADHRGLRPRGLGGRHRVRLELPARRHLLGRRRHAGAAHRQEGRRPGQAEGQEDRARLPRLALRQGADPAAAGARQDARLRAAAAAGDAARASSRRRPGCRSASSAPTTCSCGAGA